MYLYWDRIGQTMTLNTEDQVIFLGPPKHAQVRLEKEYGLTNSQAREAILQAMMNMGAEVDIDGIKKIASGDSRFYRTGGNEARSCS